MEKMSVQEALDRLARIASGAGGAERPGPLEALLSRAGAALAEGRTKQAVALYALLEGFQPGELAHSLHRAEAELAGGDPAAARATVDRLLSHETCSSTRLLAGTLRLSARLRPAAEAKQARTERLQADLLESLQRKKRAVP